MSNGMYVDNIEAWAAKCVSEPRWLAECQQRIGRFGGQHPTSNVLIHSLEVWHMLRNESPRVQLWALYHDAHEVLTGDIPGKWKRFANDDDQWELDTVLRQALGLGSVGGFEAYDVDIADTECGDAEHLLWGDVAWAHKPEDCVDTFTMVATNLITRVRDGL